MSYLIMDINFDEVIAKARQMDAYCNSSRPLQRAAIIARGAIRARAKQGKGYQGEFPQYSEAYARRMNRPRSPVTLRSSNHLLDNLSEKHNLSDGNVTLSPADSDRKKAEGLTSGRGKLHSRTNKLAQVRSGFSPDALRRIRSENKRLAKKARPFMGVTDEDERNMEKAIEADLQRIVDGN